jgi:hypothetical protein
MSTTGLECAICSTRDGVDVVCHRCGQPLCQKCRAMWPAGARTRGAYNDFVIICPDCLGAHKPLARLVNGLSEAASALAAGFRGWRQERSTRKRRRRRPPIE